MLIAEIIFWMVVTLLCGGYFFLMAFAIKSYARYLSTLLSDLSAGYMIEDGDNVAYTSIFIGWVSMVIGFILIGVSVYQRGIV